MKEQLVEEIERLRQEVDKLRREKTAHKQAEEELHASEEQYRNLFESAPEVIIVIGFDGTILDVNNAAEIITGLPREEIIGKRFTELGIVHEKDLPKYAEVLSQLASGESIQPYEVELTFKDKKHRWFEVFSALLKKDDKPYAVQVTTRDITERKQAEQAQRKSEKQASAAIEAARGFTFSYDIATGKVIWGGAIEAITGYTPEEFAQVDIEGWTERIHPEDRDEVLSMLQEAIETLDRAMAEYRFRNKDGSYVVLASISITERENGKPIRLVGILQDITERKKAEEILKESEEKYRNLFETATDGIFTMDSQTRFTSSNRKAEEMCGYSRDELIGKYATLILPEEEIPRMADALKKVLRGEMDTYETRIITKKGELLPVEVTSSPIKIDGKIIGTMGTARDITERKQAEQALRESEEKYRQLTEEINDAIYATDQDGNVTYVSPVIEWLTGYSSSEIMGRSVAEFLHEEDLPRAIEGLERVLSGHSTEGEYRLHTKSGEIRWMGTSNRAIFAGDRVVGVQGVLTDITERKKAEEILRQSEEKYRTILENVVEGYYETDLAGNFTLVNDSICRSMGYSRDELLGMNNRDYMDEQTARKVLERFAEVYTTGIPARGFEFEIIRKDGTKIATSSSVSVIMDSQGQPTGFRGVVRNVTTEKQAEETLRQNEARYRTILESIEHGYFEVDLKGNLTFFNDSMCEITGYPRDEMMGMNNRQYMEKENARKVYQTFNRVYTTGKPDRGFDWEVTRKDGTKRIVEASVFLVRDSKDKPTGFRGIVRDITERRKAEAERKALEQQAQVAARLSTMGEMASGIVHEINNPLTSVVGFAEILAQQDLPEDAREYARIIGDEGKRVTGIANRLLSFARHQKPETVYTDINKLIEDTIELQTYEMRTGNIKVTTEFDPHLPQTMADPGQLQQVFLNIMLNARKEMRAAHGGGNFLVKTQASDGTIQISLKDDGPGIRQKNLERIFEPFFTTKKVRKGTGLGLSICQGIITSHNGKIYARSTPGKGATFIIELPVVARRRKTTQAGAAIDTPRSPTRVRR